MKQLRLIFRYNGLIVANLAMFRHWRIGKRVGRAVLCGIPCLIDGVSLCNFAEIVKLLLAHKADVNLKTKSGDTPLHGAVFGNNPLIFQALLREGLLIFQ